MCNKGVKLIYILVQSFPPFPILERTGVVVLLAVLTQDVDVTSLENLNSSCLCSLESYIS